MTPQREEFEKWAATKGDIIDRWNPKIGTGYINRETALSWLAYQAALTFAYRASCPYCAADWPVEHSHGECPVIHVRPATLWRNPSADHVQCQAARLRAMAENWPFNPVIAAERG